MAGDLRDLRDDLRIVMVTADYERTVSFYRDTLGLPVVASWDGHDDDPPGTVLRAGGGTIEVALARPDRDAVDPSGFLLMIRTADPDAEHGRLTEAGADVLDDVRDTPWGYREFAVADPNGVRVTLYTVVDPDAAGHD